jgi:hypothetical protein
MENYYTLLTGHADQGYLLMALNYVLPWLSHGQLTTLAIMPLDRY